MELLNGFRKYLLDTVPRMVIKDSKRVQDNATENSRALGDIYTSVCLETDTFWSHESYNQEVIMLSGITNDPSEALDFVRDKRLIPEESRTEVLIAQRDYIKRTYVEMNEYYREISGKRPLDSEPIMVTKEYLYQFGYTGKDDAVALDDVSEDIGRLMESSGEIDRFLSMYPNATYLKYLGERRIDIAQARRAEDFQLLYFPKQDNAYRFYRDFVTVYEEVRSYYMTKIFNYSFSDTYNQYHSFIGFMILMTSIERMINSVFRVVVNRNFYDLESIRVFLDEFHIPYVDLFSLNQQQLLVKNMNILLRKKGCEEVLYDVLNLLGYKNFDLYKYILVKQHKLHKENDEAQPVPVFYYKTTVDENGVPQLVQNTDLMFEYYFYAVPMNERDIVLGDTRDDNGYEYYDVVLDDDTWLDDNDLSIAKENMLMNFTETKYAMLNLKYHVQAVSTEITYLTRLILDRKIQTSSIKIEMSLLSGGESSLFDIWCILICLICRRNELESTIIDTSDLDLVVWGWNYNADFEGLIEEVRKKPDIYSSELQYHLKQFSLGNTIAVNEAINSIKEFKRIIVSTCLKTSDPTVYHLNLKLYNSVMLEILDNEAILTLRDGSLAKTYYDYLKEYNPEILEFYDLIEDSDECIDYINYIGTKMGTLFPSTEYLSYLNPIDTTLLNAILTILRAFKSFTVDIKDSNTVYQFDDRFTNLMKMMDKGWLRVNLKAWDPALRYNDNIHLVHSDIETDDEFNMQDGYFFETHLEFTDAGIINDKLLYVKSTFKAGSSMDETDAIHSAQCNMIASPSHLGLKDSFRVYTDDDLPPSLRERLIYK